MMPPSLSAGIVGKLLAKLVQLEHLGLGHGWRHGNRRVNAHRQLSLPADFVEQIELLFRPAHGLNAGDAEFLRLANGRKQSRQLFIARRLRKSSRDKVHGIVFEDACGFAVGDP